LLPIPDFATWYCSPYLTCTECNGVSFIDALAVKQALVRDAGALETCLDLEMLPGCCGCGRTHTFVVGALDLSLLIGANKEARARLVRLKNEVASRLQAVYRGRKGRMLARARKSAVLAYKRLVFYACAGIQRVYRGYLDRRRHVVERSLLLIKVRPPLRAGLPPFMYTHTSC
jgi:hypothetical protein